MTLQPVDPLPCHDDMDFLYWSMVIILILGGLAGSVLPLLPGTTLILLGVLLQKWLMPGTLSSLAVVWIAVFWFMSIVTDIGGTLLGTRLFGGSKWGMAGAGGGAFVGMFISLPALLLGSILGAVVSEKWLGRRSHKDALRSGAGAAVGFLLAGVARVSCALVMIGLYAVSVWNLLPKKV